MKQTKYFIPLLLILSLLIMINPVMGASCDYTEYDNCMTENRIYKENLSDLTDRYNNLSLDYKKLKDDYKDLESERDYYKSRYLNSSLGNLTVQDFIDFTNNVYTYHTELNTDITNLNQDIKNLNFKFKIEFVLLSISVLGLFSLTFVLWKKSKKIINTIQTEVKNILIRNETKKTKKRD